jgi:tetratricopeptide (TPR) repeat protein
VSAATGHGNKHWGDADRATGFPRIPNGGHAMRRLKESFGSSSADVDVPGAHPRDSVEIVRQELSDQDSGGPDRLIHAIRALGEPPDEARLVELCCTDQVDRWRGGERIPAEAYLALHPALQGESEAAFELIYGEYILRESLGETPTAAEFTWRFPRFADRLQRQLGLHRALGAEPAELDSGSEPPLEDGESAPADDPELAGGGVEGPEVPGYRILGALGHGGMGVVYKARQLNLNRLVALKVIRAGLHAGPEVASRFRAEAEMVARFQHPNIIQIFEVGESEGVSFLALEYASGGSLQEKLAGTPQDPQAAARLLEELARVVHYAHQRGIVHRDLKPANVVLTDEGVPKVTDFGLAKLLEHDDGLTHTDAILGTPSYMAPEQVRGDSRSITPAADVYALGAILYEMLTGRPPFKGATPLSTLEQVASQEPLAPGTLQRHVARDLETICLKCLEKEPPRRYASAQDLADDLRRFLEGRPIAARPTSAWRRSWKWARRNPTTATALAAGCLGVVILYAGALYYNARLQDAVRQARTAERLADSSARSAVEQRNLALKVLNQLVFDVQENLGETPATRPFRHSLLDTAIAGLDEIARSAEASAPDVSRAVAHQKLGDIFHEIDRGDDARRQYRLALKLARALDGASPRDPAIVECLYRVNMGLGELELQDRKAASAQTDFRNAVALAETLVAISPSRPGARRGLIEAYLELGRSFGFAHDLAEAEVWFRKTLALADQWAADEPGNTQAGEMQAWSYRKLADMRKLSRDYPMARRYYLKAIEIGDKLLEAEPRNHEYQRNLAVALHDLARMASSLRDYVTARPLFERAERLLLELTHRDPEDVESQIWLVRVQADWARLERDDGHYATAQARFQTVIARLIHLRREGRLEGRPQYRAQAVRRLRQESADCALAPAALGDLAAVRARPVGEASRMLLVRARLLALRSRLAAADAAVQALCQLDPGTIDRSEDAYGLAASLAECVSFLDTEETWADRPPALRDLRRRECTDRAIAALDRAVRLGFDDVERLERDGPLDGLREHPGFRALVAHLRQAAAHGREASPAER